MRGRPETLDLARLAVLDFEGSCYPDEGKSFPIEVAVCRLRSDEARSWLIRPHEAWRDWTWDAGAEQSHGLTRERLEQDGIAADRVLDELAAFAAGFDVVSDSESDDWWLEALAKAAGRRIPFALGSTAHVLKLLGVEGQTQDDPVWQEADRLARERFPRRHRAEPDARRGAEIIRLVATRTD